MIPFIFFTLIFIVFYAYLGYGILLWLLVTLKRLWKKEEIPPFSENELPHVTLIIPAYNERDFIKEKILNTQQLDYPSDKLNVLFVTDGSTDGTNELVAYASNFHVSHSTERKGKMAAINRVMPDIETPITVFCDANTSLNKEAIKKIVRHYKDPKVGGVSGEKRVQQGDGTAVGGEGIYWKYESFLKQLDSEFYTVVGAAGELFSIRTALYEHVEEDTILDDFIISLRICLEGYTIKYEPGAYAVESASASLAEEQKRKVRISAGGFQSIVRLKKLLNVFKHPVLSLQYISHRFLRWAVCPFLLPVIFLLNIYLAINETGVLYKIMLAAQIIFYLLALAGFFKKTKQEISSLLKVPFYFTFMNYCLYLGFIKYKQRKQTVIWEKAKRLHYK